MGELGRVEERWVEGGGGSKREEEEWRRGRGRGKIDASRDGRRRVLLFAELGCVRRVWIGIIEVERGY